MRKVIVGAMVSLDGVMQAPGGPDEDPVSGFEYGGWVWPLFDETLGEALDEMFSRPFDLLLGRKTYDIFAAYWPYVEPDNSIGPLFDRVNKYVATRDPERKLEWQNSHRLGPDAVAAVKKLKEEDGPDLLTQGSTVLIKALFENGLVDEINMSVFPVVLGRGKRLFGEDSMPATWKLVSSKTSGSGVTVNRYVRDGEVATGSFALVEPTEAELERRRNLT
ncbi:dihydrofolate reductase family protein [Chelativorans salis]|uniref:Dihydrofolate reductase family protein n=1 Tax=Chelativorans salis TaxID=2978478 RepID=A0ABT2LLC0_9HYPH|nr:dihydrofolate reductase family protein [Chelativorans sp. EGI FJ00035]MCT7374849.1 dihydrofolate reductase family protein [Chelativorans sp. EGI FJ00035]